MGILIVFIILLVIGIILCKKGEMFSFSKEIGFGLGIIGAIGIIVCALLVFLIQIAGNYDKRIKLEEQYNAIQRIMNDDNFRNGDVRVKNQVYNDIAEYNADVRTNKHYRDNIWTNWYICRCYDDFDVIELEVE